MVQCMQADTVVLHDALLSTLRMQPDLLRVSAPTPMLFQLERTVVVINGSVLQPPKLVAMQRGYGVGLGSGNPDEV